MINRNWKNDFLFFISGSKSLIISFTKTSEIRASEIFVMLIIIALDKELKRRLKSTMAIHNGIRNLVWYLIDKNIDKPDMKLTKVISGYNNLKWRFTNSNRKTAVITAKYKRNSLSLFFIQIQVF